MELRRPRDLVVDDSCGAAIALMAVVESRRRPKSAWGSVVSGRGPRLDVPGLV